MSLSRRTRSADDAGPAGNRARGWTDPRRAVIGGRRRRARREGRGATAARCSPPRAATRSSSPRCSPRPSVGSPRACVTPSLPGPRRWTRRQGVCSISCPRSPLRRRSSGCWSRADEEQPRRSRTVFAGGDARAARSGGGVPLLELARVVVEQELGPARAPGRSTSGSCRRWSKQVPSRRAWCITPDAAGDDPGAAGARPDGRRTGGRTGRPHRGGCAISPARSALPGVSRPADRAALLQRCAIELYLINRPVEAIELAAAGRRPHPRRR